MECMLQWLDELEDLLYCLPMLWARIRTWLLLALSSALAALTLISPPALAVAPAPALLALCVLVAAVLAQVLRAALLRGPAMLAVADRA